MELNKIKFNKTNEPNQRKRQQQHQKYFRMLFRILCFKTSSLVVCRAQIYMTGINDCAHSKVGKRTKSHKYLFENETTTKKFTQNQLFAVYFLTLFIIHKRFVHSQSRIRFNFSALSPTITKNKRKVMKMSK